MAILSSKVILVVEDDHEDAMLIEDALRSIGPHTPVICRNASEARAYLKGSGMYAKRAQHPFPDGIVCDMYLGAESGLEFLEWSKASDTFKTLPVMMLTGAASAHELFTARKSGAVKVSRKPERLSDLRQVLSDFVETIGA